MLRIYEGIVQQGHVQLQTDETLSDGLRVLVTILPPLDESVARRKANRWLAEYVGDRVLAAHPLLTLAAGQQVWRFGAYSTSLERDPCGPIGYVDVDAETGAVLADETAAQEIADYGEQFECASLPPGG